MKSLEEKTIRSDKIYKGKLLDVRKDEVLLPNEKIGFREWIHHPGAACCIPVLPGNKIILIKQYRYAVREESIEVPAGKLDLNEKPEQCAYRELKEETGYETKKLTFLTSIYPAIGFANEIIWIYLAENLMMDCPNTDNDEFVETLEVDFVDAINMIYKGLIKDSKTIIGLMWLDKYFKKFRM
ncbi:MAG: ADP-ribose pyrophosphatase [Candidatus Marinimicrobia bacterium]|nr:ADP-ribose pyrophosphatase [Candidatus Neomarinimicrobiota bacterium]|tara:strand:+ start:5742 stop:6290 length:549 start_codon:yes stop_codon:yes gene_type:complete